MKKITLFLAIMIAFYACKLEVVGPAPDPNVKPKHINKFTCKVNGEFWEAVPKELEGSFKRDDLQVDVFILKGDTLLSVLADNRKGKEASDS